VDSMTSSSGLAATALTRVRGILFGFAQGAVIGAVAALAAQFFATRRNVDALTKSVVDQAAQWDPYRTKLDAVRSSTVLLYNDQLALVKLQGRDTGERLEREIAALEKGRALRQRAMEDERRPQWLRENMQEQVAGLTVEIDKNKIKIEEWRDLMARTPLTVGGVQTSLQALRSDWSETTVEMGDTYAIWMAHDAMLTASMQAAARDRVAARDWQADQELAAIRRAMTEREQAATAEMAIEQAKAATLGALSGAVLAVAGQRNRAAIALSKLLALAQIAIQTRVAYMAALAPPPLGLGPVAGQPLANWVLLQGIASGVAVAAASLGSGGGSSGGAGGSTSVPATAREIGPSASAQPLPQTINIYIDGNLVDLSQLSRELRPYQIQLTKDTI